MTEEAFAFLGKTSFDKASGVKGIVTSISFLDTGCIQLGIQPKGDGSTMPDSWSIDIENVELCEGPEIKATSINSPTNYVGEIVREKLTRVEGKAVKRLVFINGCEYYVIRHKNLSRNGEIILTQLPAGDLELVTKGGMFGNKSEVEPSKPSTRTGGPNHKAPRI